MERGGGGSTGHVETSNGVVLLKGLASNVTLETVPKAPLSFAPGREYHPPIFGTLGDRVVQVKRERELIYNSQLID